MKSRERRGTWILAVLAVPGAVVVLCLAGGRIGRSVALGAVAALAVAAIVIAQRRRGGRAPSSYAIPPAQLLAAAVVGYVAAIAIDTGGVVHQHGALADWTGVAAALAALVGIWAFLAARVRERALDMVL